MFVRQQLLCDEHGNHCGVVGLQDNVDPFGCQHFREAPAFAVDALDASTAEREIERFGVSHGDRGAIAGSAEDPRADVRRAEIGLRHERLQHPPAFHGDVMVVDRHRTAHDHLLAIGHGHRHRHLEHLVQVRRVETRAVIVSDIRHHGAEPHAIAEIPLVGDDLRAAAGKASDPRRSRALWPWPDDSRNRADSRPGFQNERLRQLSRRQLRRPPAPLERGAAQDAEPGYGRLVGLPADTQARWPCATGGFGDRDCGGKLLHPAAAVCDRRDGVGACIVPGQVLSGTRHTVDRDGNGFPVVMRRAIRSSHFDADALAGHGGAGRANDAPQQSCRQNLRVDDRGGWIHEIRSGCGGCRNSEWKLIS